MKSRAQKQREAEKRQARREARSVLRQLELLKSRPGQSKRETTRLRKIIEPPQEVDNENRRKKTN